MAPRKRNRKPHLGLPIPDAINPVHQLRVMGRLVRRSAHKVDAPPGTLVHTGRKKVEQVRIRFLDYDEGELSEREVKRIEDVFPLRETPTVTWINIDGLHDVEVIRDLGEHYGFHPLVLEDLVSVGQRPKLEEHDGYLFLVLRMLTLDEASFRIEDEQVSFLVGPHWVFSFQERVGDVFEGVRERIRSSRGRIRARGPDYLAYALMDAVVDRYFAILEKLGDRTEVLDVALVEDPEPGTLRHIHELKQELLVVRKAVWPLRDVMSGLVRSDSPLVADETKVFLRDVHDHAVQVVDAVETLRDLASSMVDLYLSSLGQKTNEVMKVLTIMASIFIPLTFLAGVYGMNFEHMPELDEPWAYPVVWALMILSAGGMLWYFKRKGWI